MALFEIKEEQIIDRIKFENPWWIENKIDDFYHLMKRRLYFSKFIPLVNESEIKRAVVLMGSRRVGKTVMIYHTIQYLIDTGIDPKKICYLSIETPIFDRIGIDQLFSFCRKAIGQNDLKGYYIFFDEIQYLKDWAIHLKTMVDSYHHSKFIVSGSAAAALKLKSNESGAGRFTEFTLPALTFHEYIHLKELDGLIIPKEKKWINTSLTVYDTWNIEELNKHFINYINYGGYPEVSLSKDIQQNPGRYIKSDIIDKVLLRDLPILYGIQDVQELNSLFTTIAFNSGNEFSFDNLAISSGVSKNTIKKYINYLEAAFLIKVVNRIDMSGKKFKRAHYFKIYLTNPSLRSALFSPIHSQSDVVGNMVETAIYAQWFHRYWQTIYYSRWKNGEVDIVSLKKENLKPAWAVEIKWTNRFVHKPKELKSLDSFIKQNKLNSAIVTTIDKTKSVKFDEYTLDFMPSALYCYTIGKRTLE